MNQPENKVEPTLYQRIIAEVRPYLGNQADEFIRRQCLHIKVAPEKLEKKDMESLAYWIGSSAKLLLSRDTANLLRQRITALGE